MAGEVWRKNTEVSKKEVRKRVGRMCCEPSQYPCSCARSTSCRRQKGESRNLRKQGPIRLGAAYSLQAGL
jgi:hypothetical protein